VCVCLRVCYLVLVVRVGWWLIFGLAHLCSQMKVLFVVAGLLAIVALSSALPHKHHALKHNSRKIKSDLTALHRDLEAVTHGKPSLHNAKKASLKSFKKAAPQHAEHAAEDYEDSDDSDNESFAAPVTSHKKFAAKPKHAAPKFGKHAAPKFGKHAPVAHVDDESDDSEDETFSTPHNKFAKKIASRAEDDEEFADENDMGDDFADDDDYESNAETQQPAYRAPRYSAEDESLLDQLNPFATTDGEPSMLDDAVNTMYDMTPDLGIASALGLEEDGENDAEPADEPELEEDDEGAEEGWGLF